MKQHALETGWELCLESLLQIMASQLVHLHMTQKQGVRTSAFKGLGCQQCYCPP